MSGRSDNHNRQEQNRRRNLPGGTSSDRSRQYSPDRSGRRRGGSGSGSYENPYVNLTPYERYLREKKRKRAGRIIFWVILIEAVCLAVGAFVLLMPKEDPELDEHVWLSLKNAKVLCTVIEEALEKVDPDHAKEYQANLETFTAQLDALDESYQEAAASAQYDTLLFGDRFPFRYLTDDYGLSYYAAFAGCSAETEASFDTIIFLADRMDELELPAILTLEGTDHRIAQTVLQTCREKDRKILEMDSMQSVTAKDVEEGASYLQIMEKNLEVLREALG